MSALVLGVATVTAVLIGWAIIGPAVISGAGPALARAPRTALGFLIVSGALTIAALTSTVLVLAWAAGGPALLPGRGAEMCQLCLQAASPFETTTMSVLPPGVPLLVVAALVLALTTRAIARTRRRRRVVAREVAARLRDSTTTALHGHPVRLIADLQPRAFSLPTRRGGIVISRGALIVLGREELIAVLEHEAAHLRQHHHVVATNVDSWFGPLTRIPVFAAIVAAVPHYLELAADDAARRRCGTPALARALLQLGTEHRTDASTSIALYASGQHRVGHLVAPAPLRRGIPALGLGLGMVGLTGGTSAAVVALYATTLLTGCTL